MRKGSETSNVQPSVLWALLPGSPLLSCNSFRSFSSPTCFNWPSPVFSPLWIPLQCLARDILSLTRFPKGVPIPSTLPITNFLHDIDLSGSFLIRRDSSLLILSRHLIFRILLRQLLHECPKSLPHFSSCFSCCISVENH